MKPANYVLLIFVIVKIGLQYSLVSPEYDLQRDEYLHLDQANHLAWGYLSLPPATSWIAYLIKLLGGATFWVRFFPALFGGLTLAVVWKAVEDLGGKLWACIIAASGVLFSALLRLNILFQPNALDILCWTLFLFFVLRYFLRKEGRWLYWSAALLALGFLNKYSILILFIGLILAVLVFENRKVFSTRTLYMAGLLSMLLVSPNLHWQYENGFPVLAHMQELRANQLVHNKAADFFREQLFYFAGSLLLLLSGLIAPFGLKYLRPTRFMSLALPIVLLLLAMMGAKGYYAIGLYPIYLALGAVFLEQKLRRSSYKWVLYLLPVLPITGILPVYAVLFPNKSPQHIAGNPEAYRSFGMLRWEDGKEYSLPQDFADMLGWRELAAKVDSVYSGIADAEETLLLCDNYGQAGAINYYSQKGLKAHSFNADYLNWWNLEQSYRHLIRVISYWEVEGEIMETAPYFESYDILGRIENEYAREKGSAIVLFREAKMVINPILMKEVRERQAAYRAF